MRGHTLWRQAKDNPACTFIAAMTLTRHQADRSPRRRKTGGRIAGTPNKVTSEFRETVRKLLDANADNIAVWLESVAEGDLEHGRAPDPARALDLLIKVAEFAVPKTARVEYTGAQNSPVRPTAIKVEFVNAPAPQLDQARSH